MTFKIYIADRIGAQREAEQALGVITGTDMRCAPPTSPTSAIPAIHPSVPASRIAPT